VGKIVTEKQKAALLGKRFNVVPMCNIKSHFVTIYSRVLHGIMRQLYPEFNQRKIELTGENRETHWKSIFDCKRLKTSKKKVFAGTIETDGVSIRVHYQRLKAGRPIVSTASPVANHEDEKEVDPATQ